jgi:glucose/arabinose dehydrogenase
MYTLARILVWSNLVLFGFSLPSRAQDGYPPGTLVPLFELDLQPVEVKVPPQYADAVERELSLNLPPGFTASVFAAGLNNPRFMAFDQNDVLHVANMARDQILALPDRDQDGVADRHIVAAGGFGEAHSIAFYQGDMYVADTDKIVRFRDSDGDLVYEERELLVDLTSPGPCCNNGWHTTRTIVIDAINEKIYVGIGSPCDLCRPDAPLVGAGPETLPANPEWGAILEFNIDGKGRRIFATGVRNVIGMTLHPLTNEIWANNNGHDLEGRTKPPEWIDIIRDGDFLGHPLIHSHQVWNDFNIERYQHLLPITAQDSLLVAQQKRPVALVPAHYAPMAIHFYTDDQFPDIYKNTAFVAFRAGLAKLSSHPGYQVAALFSEPDGSQARMAPFITGFQTGNSQNTVWGFPVGLATDAEGSLFVGSNAGQHLILKVTHSPVSGSWQHNLPDVVSAGRGRLDLVATVQIERQVADGSAPRVTADLSPFGGPSALPLEALGDNTFRLETNLDLTGLPNGVYALQILIEQDVAGKTHVFKIIKHIALLPQDVAILDDALAADWRLTGANGAQVLEPQTTGPVFNGLSATPVQVAPENFFTPWSVAWQPSTALDLFGFAGFRFAFHPGNVQPPNVPSLGLQINGLIVDLIRGDAALRVDMDRNEWQVIEVPLSAFNFAYGYSSGRVDGLIAIDQVALQGNITGTFYLDDVRLVRSIPAAPPSPPTAVLEEHQETTPQEFALDQNYPNPFNSRTMIGFGLPSQTQVSLVVYNLAGQHVATLVKGTRPAGHYNIQWNSRDDDDRPLASGLYLYRLQAGQQVAVRKFLLLR